MSKESNSKAKTTHLWLCDQNKNESIMMGKLTIILEHHLYRTRQEYEFGLHGKEGQKRLEKLELNKVV